MPEITHHCPKTPIILVGTKVDLRTDSEIMGYGGRVIVPITYEQGLDMSHKCGCIFYLEVYNNLFKTKTHDSDLHWKILA